MVRGFSEQEKDRIRNHLIQKGKEFLELYGIRKTNVEDLTKAVGISKGAFYLFFKSKEELFFHILEQFEQEVRELLIQDIFQNGGNPKQSFSNFIFQFLEVVEQSPLLKLLNKEEVEHLMRKLPPEMIEEHMKKDDDFVFRFIEKQIENGHFHDSCDPMAVSGIFKTFFFMALHKAELGDEMYGRTRDLMIDMLSNYLVKE